MSVAYLLICVIRDAMALAYFALGLRTSAVKVLLQESTTSSKTSELSQKLAPVLEQVYMIPGPNNKVTGISKTMNLCI